MGQDFPESRKIATTNPAFLNPVDLERLGVAPGALVEIESEHDRILAVVEPSDELQSGVVSMAHCWGAGPERDAEVRSIGSNTGRLIATSRDYDPITGMARQSAIPVTIRVAREDEAPKRDQGGILRPLVETLTSRMEKQASDDPFGRDASFVARMRPLIQAVNLYFGTEVRGFENLPEQGGCLIVGNHSGAAEASRPVAAARQMDRRIRTGDPDLRARIRPALLLPGGRAVAPQARHPARRPRRRVQGARGRSPRRRLPGR